MIRRATQSDIPKLIELAKRFHLKTHYAHIDFIEDHARYQIEAWLLDPSVAVFMSDSGAIGVSYSRLFFNRLHIIGSELFFYNEKGAPLMESAVKWLSAQSAEEINFIFQGKLNPRRRDAAIKLFERQGLTVCGIAFSKPIT